MEKIGQLIKTYRNATTDEHGKHISQLDLALTIGWENPSTLSRIESNRVAPTRATIIRIGKALKLDRKNLNLLLAKAQFLGLKEREYAQLFAQGFDE